MQQMAGFFFVDEEEARPKGARWSYVGEGGGSYAKARHVLGNTQGLQAVFDIFDIFIKYT